MKRLIASFVLGLISLSFGSLADAQSLTTGAISGTVVDQSGAVMASVVVTAKNVDTGATRETQTAGSGNFLLAQLDPGRYEVTAESAGFEKTKIGPINVAVSRVASLEFRLKIGSSTATVEVKQEASPIEPSNPNTATTFSGSQLANIPNPGNDLSYVANLTPGAVMNVTGGVSAHGNTEFNGQPSLANDFTVDGLNANDIVDNLNYAGASGLQLGLNAIQEVSVNTSSYSVTGGRSSGSHINFVTKSGTNNFHGNLYEVWNGSVMNATNFFLNAVGARKPRSNVNEFGGSIGGPVLKNRLFFFTDLEGIRIVIPKVVTTTLPTPAYQSYVLQQLPQDGGLDFGFIPLPPQPAEVPFYKQMFSLLGDTSRGNPLVIFDCPFDVGGGSPATPGSGNGCANRRTFSLVAPTNETLFTVKLDYNQNSENNYWFRFQSNDGTNNSALDPVNSIFSSVRPILERRGAAGWTHVFTPALVNQFNPGLSYTSNSVHVADAAKASALPISYSVIPFSTIIGGFQFSLPGIADSTIWQLNDNLSWTKGKHSFQFGENLRRVLFTTIKPSGQIPFEFAFDLKEFTHGAAALSLQLFNANGGEDRLANVNFDFYAMDTYKATSKLTLVVGLRAAWNSDPISQKNKISRLAGSFATISHDVNQPLNQVVIANQGKFWGSTPLLMWQPRTAVAYQFSPRTVLRAGLGVFTNAPDLSQLTVNPPAGETLFGGPFGNPGVGGIAIAPSVPGSLGDAGIAAFQRLQQNFSNGGLSCASPMSSPNTCISRFLFTDAQSGRHEYPYSMEWSAGIERELGKNVRGNFRYVGTKTLKGAYYLDENAYQTLCQGCFAPLPFSNPVDPRFGEVPTYQSGANSYYHALQITAEKRMGHGLALQGNYTYSHCLDTQSNAGSFQFNQASLNTVFPPNNLKADYGNCDYDVRHSMNAWYVYEFPFHSAKSWLNHVVGGWQISETVFLRGGFPFSVLSTFPSSGVFNANVGGVFANTVPGQNPYMKSNVPGVTQAGTIQWLNPSAFQSVVNPQTLACYPANTPQNCKQGDQSRNSLRAPGFRWTDLSITKSFRLTERVALRVDGQFYNLFNHPNFGFPSNTTAGIPGVASFSSSLVNFGTISNTVSPTTGLLGAGLGGDSSVRMIALRGRIEF